MTGVARKVKLYMFSGSAPSLTARLMLERKGIDHKAVHLMVGPHAFGMLGRGFQTMTVPALRIDGRRVQGSREISRALDELAPRPPLFAAEAQRRRAVEEAEEWGEELQDAVRRILLCAARRDPRAFLSVYRHANPLMRPAQRVSRRLVTRLATAAHRATDRAGERDLAALPARLDRIDAWIDEGRPAARLAQRVAPEFPGQVPAVLPPAWLEPLRGAGGAAPESDPMGPGEVLRALGTNEDLSGAPPRQDVGPLPSWRYGR